MTASTRLGDRAAVVVGASTGIGQACALRLDKLGFRVFAGIRREGDAHSLAKRASARLTPVYIDVTDADSISSAVGAVRVRMEPQQSLGLVNAAGIAVPGPLEVLPLDEVRKVLETNIVGHIAVVQAFLPLLRQNSGRIVTIGSIGGTIALPFNAPYHASKFAMEALSDSLRTELRPWKISVSLVEPGIIRTPIWEKSLAAADELFASLPPDARSLYDPYTAGMRAVVARATTVAVPADRVADAVVHALTAHRPRSRYRIGRSAMMAAVLFRHVPAPLRDYLALWCLRSFGRHATESTQEPGSHGISERHHV